MQTVTRARKTKATNKKGAADLDSGPWFHKFTRVIVGPK